MCNVIALNLFYFCPCSGLFCSFPNTSGSYEDTADLLERMERDARLHKAVGKLTETQQRGLRQYYFDGLTYSQIARLEGVYYRSVIDSINQAIKRLRKLYQE